MAYQISSGPSQTRIWLTTCGGLRANWRDHRRMGRRVTRTWLFDALGQRARQTRTYVCSRIHFSKPVFNTLLDDGPIFKTLRILIRTEIHQPTRHRACRETDHKPLNVVQFLPLRDQFQTPTPHDPSQTRPKQSRHHLRQ